MVLIAIRLLMPPGICVCQWSSPAARLLIALVQSEREVPVEDDRDDDHAPGCPASPLAVGMGVKPSAEPPQPPGLSLDLPPLESAQPLSSVFNDTTVTVYLGPPPNPLYLTLRALLL